MEISIFATENDTERACGLLPDQLVLWCRRIKNKESCLNCSEKVEILGLVRMRDRREGALSLRGHAEDL